MPKLRVIALTASLLVPVLGEADEPRDAPSPALISQLCRIDMKGDKKDEWLRLPRAETSVTQHHLGGKGAGFDYTATAGTLIIRDDEDKPMAAIGYVAYTRHDVRGVRPITFAFNGGPGSSSLWLHMGALGPRRVVVGDPAPTAPAPYRLVDNEYGVLDKSDLVLIDPVGTGLAHAVCNHHDDEFWSVDPDVESISRFIAQYSSDNGRWNSPKYLLGESYGTTRGAAIANYLRGRRALDLNGLILVSVATDIEAIFAEVPGNDRPYSVYLPAFAAVAWFHHQVPEQPAQLEPFLAQVRAFAQGPFAAALAKGDALPEAELDTVAQQAHAYTGLSVEYLKAARLRISENAFAHELLKAQGKTIGRLDGRYVGTTWDPLAKETDYDPVFAAIAAAYTATFLDYFHQELKAGAGETYRTTNFSIGEHWKWTHKTAIGEQPFANTGVDLGEALVKAPNLRVLVMNGYYDLATPFSATEYVMSHLGVPAPLSQHISLKYYEAGHMMYVHPPALAKMKQDLDEFIAATAR